MMDWFSGGSLDDVWVRGAAVLFDAAAKGFLLMVLAGVASVAMRRASAASRHLVWVLALAGLILLPALSVLMPKWQLPILPARETSATTETAQVPPPSWRRPVVSDAVAPDAFYPVRETAGAVSAPAEVGAASVDESPVASGAVRLSPAMVLMAVWLFGALMASAPLAIGLGTVGAMVRRARPFDGAEWDALIHELSASLALRRTVRVLRAPEGEMPMAAGLVRPTILLPAESGEWPDEKRRAVLLHELAHARRRDCLTHAIGRVAAALHWFNPLAWLALRLLCVERERACDDLVLAAGERPTAYADHLLDIARTMHAGTLTSAAAITMARKSQLEGRLVAVLDPLRNRRTVTVSGIVAGLLAMLVVGAALAAVQVGEKAGKGAGLWRRARPVKKTTLEAKGIHWRWGRAWRDLPFSLSKEEEADARECARLVRRVYGRTDGKNDFASEDTRKQLLAVLERRPGYFYAEYLLGTWHRMNGNAEEARRFYGRAFQHAPVVIVQPYVDTQGRPFPSLEIQTFALECNRVKKGYLDPSLELSYPMLETDSHGAIYMPCYKTVFRTNSMSFPSGYHVAYPRLGWFETKHKVGRLPDAKVEAVDGGRAKAGSRTTEALGDRSAKRLPGIAADLPAGASIGFDNGATAELVGVREREEPMGGRGGVTWWRANGEVFGPDSAPGWVGATVSPEEGLREITFVVRIPKRTPDEDLAARVEVDGVGPGSMSATSDDTSEIRCAAARYFEPEKDETTVRVGVAAGPWVTLVDMDTPGAYGGDSHGIAWSIARGKPSRNDEGGLSLVVSHNVLKWNVRLVGTAPSGRRIVARNGGRYNPQGLRQDTFVVPGLADPDDLKSVAFQVRDYEWREFQGVALRPKGEVHASAYSEVTLYDGGFLDLDSGQVFGDVSGDEAVELRFMEKNGIDVRLEVATRGYLAAMVMFVKTRLVHLPDSALADPAAFESLKTLLPKVEVSSSVSERDLQIRPLPDGKDKDQLVTYGFWTREGALGIVQFGRAFRDEKNGGKWARKVRYRLSPEGGPDSASAAPVAKEGAPPTAEEELAAVLEKNRPVVLAHRYYPAGCDPVVICDTPRLAGYKLMPKGGHRWPAPLLVRINGKEYRCASYGIPIGSGASRRRLISDTDWFEARDRDVTIEPGRYRMSYVYRDIEAHPEDGGAARPIALWESDEVEFEVVEKMPEGYFEGVDDPGIAAAVSKKIDFSFEGSRVRYYFDSPPRFLGIQASAGLPCAMAFDAFAQREGESERHRVGVFSCGATGPATSAAFPGPGLTWENAPGHRYRLILVPSEKVALENPPIRRFYGKEIVSDWLTFESSRGYELEMAKAQTPRLAMISTWTTPDRAPGTEAAWYPDGRPVEDEELLDLLKDYPRTYHAAASPGNSAMLHFWFQRPLFERGWRYALRMYDSDGADIASVSSSVDVSDATVERFHGWGEATCIVASDDLPERGDVDLRCWLPDWTWHTSELPPDVRGRVPGLDVVFDSVEPAPSATTRVSWHLAGAERGPDVDYDVVAVAKTEPGTETTGRTVRPDARSMSHKDGNRCYSMRYPIAPHQIDHFRVRYRPIHRRRYENVSFRVDVKAAAETPQEPVREGRREFPQAQLAFSVRVTGGHVANMCRFLPEDGETEFQMRGLAMPWSGVKWKYLGSKDDGWHFEFSGVFLNDGVSTKPLSKRIVYGGGTMAIVDNDDVRVAIEPLDREVARTLADASTQYPDRGAWLPGLWTWRDITVRASRWMRPVGRGFLLGRVRPPRVDGKAVASAASLTYLRFMKSTGGRRTKPSEEIPPACWSEEMRALKPAYVYAHGENVAIVTGDHDENHESGLYVLLSPDSPPGPNDDAFFRLPVVYAGDTNVYGFQRVGALPREVRNESPGVGASAPGNGRDVSRPANDHASPATIAGMDVETRADGGLEVVRRSEECRLLPLEGVSSFDEAMIEALRRMGDLVRSQVNRVDVRENPFFAVLSGVSPLVVFHAIHRQGRVADWGQVEFDRWHGEAYRRGDQSIQLLRPIAPQPYSTWVLPGPRGVGAAVVDGVMVWEMDWNIVGCFMRLSNPEMGTTEEHVAEVIIESLPAHIDRHRVGFRWRGPADMPLRERVVALADALGIEANVNPTDKKRRDDPRPGVTVRLSERGAHRSGKLGPSPSVGDKGAAGRRPGDYAASGVDAGLDIEDMSLTQLIALLDFDPDAVHDYERAYRACERMEKMGPKARKAVPHLLPLLKDHSDRHVMAGEYLSGQAADALAAMGPRVLPDLESYLKSEDWRTRVATLWAVRRMGSKKGVPLAVRALEDEHPTVRAAAADALGAMGKVAKSAVPKLKEMLGDDAEGREAPYRLGRVSKKAVAAIRRIEEDRRKVEPRTESERRLAKARTALERVSTGMEAYVVDHSVWPEEWRQITTPIAYVRAVPQDPYAVGRALRWEKMAGGKSVVYSIGPDGVDQRGTVDYDPTNGAKSAGDLVFRFTQDPVALATRKAEPTPVPSPTPTAVPNPFRVRGHVLQMSGALEGATVRVRADASDGRVLAEMTTGADGEFDLWFGEGFADAKSGKVAPRLVFLEVSYPGMVEVKGSGSGAYVVASERPSDEEMAVYGERSGVILPRSPGWREVRMNRSATLVGAVLDGAKRPVPRARLALYQPGYIAESAVWEGKTDEAGRFTIPAIWSGSRYSLEIEGRGRAAVNLIAPGERRVRFVCRGDAIDIEEPMESTLPAGEVPTFDEITEIAIKRVCIYWAPPFRIEYALAEKSSLNEPDPVRCTEHTLEMQDQSFREIVRDPDGASIEWRRLNDRRVEIGEYPDVFHRAKPTGEARRRLRYQVHGVPLGCEWGLVRWARGAAFSLNASFGEAAEAGRLSVRREMVDGLDCVTLEAGGRVVSFAPSRDWSLVRYYDTRFSDFHQAEGYWVPGKITSESTFQTQYPAHPWAYTENEIVVKSVRVAEDFHTKGYWPIPEPRDGDRVQVEYPKWRSEWSERENGRLVSVRPQTVRDACRSGHDFDWVDPLPDRDRMIYEVSTHWREKLRIDAALAMDEVAGDLIQAPLPFYDDANEEIVWATYTGSLVRVGMLPSVGEIEVGPYRARASFRPDADRIRAGQPVKVAFGLENTGDKPFYLGVGGTYRTGRDVRYGFWAFDHTGMPARIEWTLEGIGGGLSGAMPQLAPGGAWSQTLDLGKWVQFDRPGRYTVRARRVVQALDRDVDPDGTEPKTSFLADFQIEVYP